jgi:hypothetical protein
MTTYVHDDDDDVAAHLPSRVESDAMGELTVPAGSLWGAQTQRSLENFPIGGFESRMPLTVIKAMAIIKKCCALYHAEQDFMESSISHAIAAAAEVVSAVVTTDIPLSSTVRPRTTVKSIKIKLLTVGGKQIITEDTEPLTNIDVKTNTTLKVYLTHPSLVGSSFGFSSTQPTNTVTPILDNIINSGLPGTSNSYISIQVGSQARDLYVVSSSNPSLYFKVTVTI